MSEQSLTTESDLRPLLRVLRQDGLQQLADLVQIKRRVLWYPQLVRLMLQPVIRHFIARRKTGKNLTWHETTRGDY